MIWKSLKEEWPYQDDEVWVRWTSDGISYQEKTMHEKELDGIHCLGVPEWRALDAPEWMTPLQKDKFDKMTGNWQNRVNEILAEPK